MGNVARLVSGLVLAGAVVAAAAPAAQDGGAIPREVLDDSAGDWVVDRFAGNSTAGPQFFQGPAREAGGLHKPFVAPTPDGTVYLAGGGRILSVSPGGMLRLIAGGGANRGDCAAAEAMIKVESIAYSPADKGLYFCHRTMPTVRRLFRKDGAWRVAVVAGEPGQRGTRDGPARDARFEGPRSLAVNSKGVVYLLEGKSHPKRLRRIADGRVTTLSNFRGPGGDRTITDGPLAGANLSVTNMSGQICLGDDDQTLYIADHWHFAIRKVDLKAGTISTVAGGNRYTALFKQRKGQADGPALTHATFTSGSAFVAWDPVHKALWCGGPDSDRLRWLKGGWLKTVIPAKGNRHKWPSDATGLPAKDVALAWAHVRAVDNRGRAYIIDGACPTGVWRGYKKEKRRTQAEPSDARERLQFERAASGAASPRAASALRARPTAADAPKGGKGSIKVGREVVVAQAGPGGTVRGTPHVAFGKGVYLAVWREGWHGAGGSARIFAARVDKSGKLLDDKGIEVAACRTGVQTSPRVAFGGGVFLVVWQDLRNGRDYDVLAARVSPEGKVLDAKPIALAAGPRTQALPDAASDGRGFLVVWQGLPKDKVEYRGYATTVTAGGRAAPPTELPIGSPQPKVAWNGTHYLVVYGTKELIGRRLDARGRPVEQGLKRWDGRIIMAWKKTVFSLAAAPGKGWLIVKHRSPPDYWGWGGPGAFMAYLVKSGGQVDDELKAHMKKDRGGNWGKLPYWLDLGGKNRDTWPYGASACAWDGRQFVAVWQRHHVEQAVQFVNTDLIASRLDGWKPLDAAGIPVAATAVDEKRPALASDGAGGLLCVYEKYATDGRVRICARALRTPR